MSQGYLLVWEISGRESNFAYGVQILTPATIGKKVAQKIDVKNARKDPAEGQHTTPLVQQKGSGCPLKQTIHIRTKGCV